MTGPRLIDAAKEEGDCQCMKPHFYPCIAPVSLCG